MCSFTQLTSSFSTTCCRNSHQMSFYCTRSNTSSRFRKAICLNIANRCDAPQVTIINCGGLSVPVSLAALIFQVPHQPEPEPAIYYISYRKISRCSQFCQKYWCWCILIDFPWDMRCSRKFCFYRQYFQVTVFELLVAGIDVLQFLKSCFLQHPWIEVIFLAMYPQNLLHEVRYTLQTLLFYFTVLYLSVILLSLICHPY